MIQIIHNCLIKPLKCTFDNFLKLIYARYLYYLAGRGLQLASNFNGNFLHSNRMHNRVGQF